MQIQKNVDLSKKCTFHIGGIAKNFYIPENIDDLLEIFNKIQKENIYILSAGSNILINDNKVFEHVMYMGEFDNNIEHIQNNIFYIGCSNRIQKVINYVNEMGYGGIEELYSLPALFGGIIYMNAGIGSKGKSLITISNVINKVKVFNKNTKVIEWIEKKDCEFSHRHSIFQKDDYVILGAECSFVKQSIENSKKRIQNRISKTKNAHEWGNGTFGTIFSTSNNRVLKLVSKINPRKGKIHFGKNNKNWMVNDGNGKYKDAIFLIKMCKLFHKIFFKKIECEVRIWK